MPPKAKILVIDDDKILREFASEALVEAGYEVEVAPEGREGLQKAAAFVPDLVICDLMMPGLHGYEVCQRLRDKGRKNLRILVTSSKSFESDISEAKKAGADAYMVKPYTAAALYAQVSSLIAQPARNGSAEPDTDDRETMTVHVHEDATIKTKAQIKRTEVMVRFWGTRGSSPTPGPDTVRYGGNTACVEVRVGELLFIIDCGTGIRELGLALIREFGDRPIEGHILIGHTHWDHIQGFPFFTPLYIKRNKFNIYSVRGSSKSLERVFRGQMAADYFPVPLAHLASEIQFIELEGPVHVGPVQVSYHYLNHPGVAIGFRIEAFGKSLTYVSDHESFTRLGGESEINKRQDDAIVEFARDSDILIMEAQYTEEEYKQKKGWGHSTFDDAVSRSIAANAKHMVLFHHDPAHTDEVMDNLLDYCRERIRKAGSGLQCSAAREKVSITI
ncbi:MAG: Response regulator receiver protein [Elusimicrobia bacterium]|nr:MAG: Response regulator receiver protein [Elusimicrobiota bacterium]